MNELLTKDFTTKKKTDLELEHRDSLLVICQKLLLINSEVAECTEFIREGLYSKHNVQPLMEELVDIAIRVFDVAGMLQQHQYVLHDYDLDKIVFFSQELKKKLASNLGRPKKHNKRF